MIKQLVIDRSPPTPRPISTGSIHLRSPATSFPANDIIFATGRQALPPPRPAPLFFSPLLLSPASGSAFHIGRW